MTPIDPKDIRTGDLIREEHFEPINDTVVTSFLGVTAFEYRATDQDHTKHRTHASAYYLLDRPDPVPIKVSRKYYDELVRAWELQRSDEQAGRLLAVLANAIDNLLDNAWDVEAESP